MSTTEPDSQPEPKSAWRDYLEIVLIFAIAFVFTRAFVFQQSKIPSGSMEDTLLIGDYIMVNRMAYAPVSFEWERHLLPVRKVDRGDVVVFKHPQQPELQYIKRVAGLPGDIVEIRQGTLYVNGKPQTEPFVQPDYRESNQTKTPIEVADGHFYMLGDHRNDSSDSRVWGQVPQESVKGRALLIWWSFEESRPSAFPSIGERIRAWFTKALFFPSRTRWSRCFRWIE